MVIVSELLPKACIAQLRAYGFETIPLPADPRLPRPVASHPDMLLFLSDQTLITDQTYFRDFARTQIEYICRKANLSLQLTDEPPAHQYPSDIRFNAARVGTHLFTHPTHTSPAVLSLARQHHWNIISTKQGYARCSVCPISDHALITSDPSIASSAKQNGLDVCEIHQGHISLPGYSYGFIGGCCGITNHLLFFSGSIDLHPDRDQMISFMRDHAITPISLSDEPLFDAGSLFFVKS